MIRNLKFAVALAIAFVLGGATTFYGMPRSSTATAESSLAAAGAALSPEALTRSAGPMPVQVLDNYQ